MIYSNDPVADAERYSAEQDSEIRRLPVCRECEKHIQQEKAVRIDGDWYCDDCLAGMREYTTED